MDQGVKIGILGTAAIAQNAILPTIMGLKDYFMLHGIASRDINRAEDAAIKYSCHFYGSYTDLLAVDDIRAVYIPLPNALHFEWIKKSLEKGKHVLVEKSLACSLNEVVELNEIAKSKNLALFENFQFQFHGQFHELKKIIGKGVIGELRGMRSSFGFPPFKDYQNIRYSKKLGGGALLDAGAYPIKIAQLFLGLDVSVSSASWSIDDSLDVDLWGGGFIKSDRSNQFCQFSFGFDNYYQCNVEFWGSKGKITANRIFTAKHDYNPTFTLEDKDGIRTITIEKDNHFENMFRHFHLLIDNDNRDKRIVEYNNNINQARLIEEFTNKANGK
jgi:predicted dehydrogenase